MFELSLIESIDEIPRAVFSELEGPETYPFLRREWLSAFETSGCVGADRGWIPRHLVVSRGGELVALAPAYIKLHSMGEFVFDQGWAEFSEVKLGQPYYPKFILAVPFTPATGSRILHRTGTNSSERAAVFDVLTGALPELCEKLGLSSAHVLFPDEGDSNELRERGWAERHSIQYQFHAREDRTFDDFLGRFRAKKRASIRRECRSVQDEHHRIEALSGPALQAAGGRLAHRLYLTTVDKHVWGKRYLSEGFFERVLETMSDSLQLVVAKDAEDEVLAGAFNLIGREAIYGRYWGAFADVPFLHFNVCLYEGVRQCLSLGRQRFEPGAGGEHKEGRGFEPTLTRSFHFLRDPRLSMAISDFLQREREAISEHLEGCSRSL